jgi:hypothetical protein
MHHGRETAKQALKIAASSQSQTNEKDLHKSLEPQYPSDPDSASRFFEAQSNCPCIPSKQTTRQSNDPKLSLICFHLISPYAAPLNTLRPSQPSLHLSPLSPPISLFLHAPSSASAQFNSCRATFRTRQVAPLAVEDSTSSLPWLRLARCGGVVQNMARDQVRGLRWGSGGEDRVGQRMIDFRGYVWLRDEEEYRYRYPRWMYV